jgi:hypothetical protein
LPAGGAGTIHPEHQGVVDSSAAKALELAFPESFLARASTRLRRSLVLGVLQGAATLPCRHGGGHQVRLMPAKDVKACVNGNKNDAADAEAICEAVRRPTRAQIAELGIVFPQGREGLEELLKIIAR